MMYASSELYHYGVKGMKWGVRRYQYSDGTLTPNGKIKYYGHSNLKSNASYLVNSARTKVTGKQYVDTFIDKGTTFSRIQTYDNFEPFAFYATYKNDDINKYMGLFGKNVRTRSEYDAKKAEEIALKTGDEQDANIARELRDKADNLKVYQLKLESTKKLKVPSDDNVSNITAKLLEEKDFKSNVIASITDSSNKMKRPSQQLLFKDAERALKKNPKYLSESEKKTIYKAFNLSLVNHNQQEIAAQNRFYSELKNKGYNAILDYNDKEFSSYHAKRPMIVFDVDGVKLQSVTETNPKIVNSMYRRYNKERIIKEISYNTVGLVNQYSKKKVEECRSYVNKRLNDYLYY